MAKLQFSTDNQLHSIAIREFSRSDWSHVDVVMPSGELLGARSDVYGDIPAGVQIRPKDYKEFTKTKIVEVECNEYLFYDFLNKQIGKPYDLEAIAAFVFDRDWRDESAWFCSELAGAALEEARGFKFKLATTANKLTPAGLFLAVSAIADVWS